MGAISEAELYPTPDNPCPPGGQAFFVQLKPDLKIRGAHWPGGQRGTALVLQGRTETIEKYFETIGALRARDFTVAALDWRGQGASSRALADPLKGHIGNFAEFMEDLAALLGALETQLPKPLLILAHSMGGHIALRALHDWPERFQGAVLSAPMLRIKQAPGPLVMILSRFLPPDLYLPGKPFDPFAERFEANLVTHDGRRFMRNIEIIRAHKALALGSPTWGWLQAATLSTRLIMGRGYLEAVRAPVLILSAEAERLVDNAAHVAAAKRLRRVTQIVVAGARHEILQETESIRQEFWRRFDSFTAAFNA
jgi:lysophospholipase